MSLLNKVGISLVVFFSLSAIATGTGKAKTGANTPQPEVVEPYIASLEVFGTDRLNEKSLRKLLGATLDEWFKRGLQGDPIAIKLQKKITDKVKNTFGFAYVDWSIMEYFEPGDLAIRVTMNVVEKRDTASRMPFRNSPTGIYPDPGKLIENWENYLDMAEALAESGNYNPFDSSCGKAYHCIFGHDHAKLKKFGNTFTKQVPKKKKELITILKKHKDPNKRAAAAFLLAYIQDGTELVKLMFEASRDSHPLVRNNALRVLGDIAQNHPQIPIPVQPLVTALNYPMVTDRSKALFALISLVERSQSARSDLLKSAVPTLMALLQSSQPNQSETSHAILKKISGKDYSLKSKAQWREWASTFRRSASKPRPNAK